MESHYNIGRLRIAMNLGMSAVESYSEHTSRLFHRELRTLLVRVFSRTIPAGLSIRLESPMVLKLGDIPGAFFERTFCQRLESTLEQALRQLLTERGDLWIRDSPAQRRALLVEAMRSGKEPVASWLTRQLVLASELWLPVLAEYALLPEGATLYRHLREETVRDLCRELAPDVTQQGNVTGDSLWLSALHYFQQHPELPIPLLPVAIVPGVPPELRVVASGSQVNRYDVRLLQTLFEHPSSPSVPLMPWLRALWQNPVVVESIRSVLSAPRIAQLHRLLTRNNPSSQSSPSFRSENRKPDLLSEAQWQPVSCAGMVLLWPVLPGLFRHLGLLEGKQFVSQQAQRRAAGCLLWLVLRQNGPPPEAVVSQLLCGLPTAGEITPEDMPDEVTRELLRQWLTGLPALLQFTWQKLSAEDIRQWFLLRPGWITPEPGKTILRIQPEAFDVLLNDWPWPVNVVPLPWLEHPLTIHWTDK